MRNRRLTSLATGLLGGLALLSLTILPARAETLSADQIIDKANLAAFYAGEDGRSQARMRIQDAGGSEQIRQFTILRRTKEAAGDQQMLVFFSRPSDVRGTVFRVEKKVQSDDDRWLYLPGLDLLRRISAGDKRTSFVGSHFFYEDVSGRNPREDSFTLVEETADQYVIDATPKNPSSVEFAGYRVWIDKSTWLPMKTEYQDGQGEVYRRISVAKVDPIQGHPTVTRSIVEDLRSGGRTLMEFRGVEYDIGLPESIFSERSMRTPPTQYLR
ncbi:outer membrane lipoprotein-sorting protein [Ferrimonas balearica]|uniref:outer membrane lipoprotein-sorting protein n=1 Tax=Ferrimonas balearica TaxID=44012 RepID=UPI001C5713B3|nr:outer membrane lipoprotein-sorting protein [Ferrimonas balearica]MBW3165188.1 outer membrane lipoprotein-sorting protein [Ferrimonas balearica]MBY5979948.1 outer membrane lipoprotein-sorting protein [Ferrimonas balearica]